MSLDMSGFFGGLIPQVLEEAGAEPGNIIAESDPYGYLAGSNGPPAGNLVLRRMQSQGGLSTALNMFVATAGAVLAGVFAVAVDLNGILLASTADRAADAALTAAPALWSPPWQVPVQLPPGDLYAGLLVVSATTMPLFKTGSQGLGTAVNLGTSAAARNIRCASAGSGLAALPAFPLSPAAYTSLSFNPWVALT